MSYDRGDPKLVLEFLRKVGAWTEEAKLPDTFHLQLEVKEVQTILKMLNKAVEVNPTLFDTLVKEHHYAPTRLQ